MILDTITYENTHTIRELMEKSVAAYSDRDILRYEREDVIYHVTYSQFNTMCHKIGRSAAPLADPSTWASSVRAA